ncbi:MAG: hypothetical protein IT330_04285 [Anaerolineae bacterium]|nr:hypothetical protein [Anaerolineae bacterium]
MDYLEEVEGRLVGFECKWGAEKWQVPSAFTRAYPNSESTLVNRKNYLEFLAL